MLRRKCSRRLGWTAAGMLLSGSVFAQQAPSPGPSATPPAVPPAATGAAPGAAPAGGNAARLLTEFRNRNTLPTQLAEREQLAEEAVRQLLPPNSPAYLAHVYHSQLLAPPFAGRVPQFVAPAALLPAPNCRQNTIYDAGNIPKIIRQLEIDRDPDGCEGSYQPAGPTTPSANAFFGQLGTNGRTCATCHQPPTGMSVAVANIKSRLQATSGTDPIFAGIDGANCPSNIPNFVPPNGTAFKAAHSLLLNRGVFRIFLPLLPGFEFTVTPAQDPYGCNTTPPFNQDTANGQTVQLLSMYRRPRISANLDFVLKVVAPPGVPAIPAIMWDGRETNLPQQAIDATFGHGHAQSLTPPTPGQVQQIVSFEQGIFSAQESDTTAQSLHAAGAKGGPQALSSAPTGQGGPPGGVAFDEYNAWGSLSGGGANARRASIARGETLFNTKQFTISNVAGLNDISLGGPPNNALPGTCSTCHSQTHAGNNLIGNAAAVDIGVAGDSAAHNGPSPSNVLPIFTVTCTGGKTTSFNGGTVTTNDPGQAMITGKCADIGKFMIPQLRALASRQPYFHDGSAATLTDVVNFYNKRFSIGLTPNQISDLVHFLSTL